MAFFVQAVHNPRPAVYVASQFVRKLSVDGHHQRQRPGVIICLGMLSLFHTIDYYFFLRLCPGRGTAVATQFARFSSNNNGHDVMIHLFFLLFLFCKSQRHSLFRQSTIHGRPCTWLRNSSANFPWTATINVNGQMSLFVYAAQGRL